MAYPAPQRIDAGTRFLSMFIDHATMTMVAMVFVLPPFLASFSEVMVVSHKPADLDFFGNLFPWFLAGLSLYFCKDGINGRSPAKRLLKLQVVDAKTGEAAHPLRCLLRDVFCIFWPVEVVVALISPERRLGDLVAGTRLVRYDASRPVATKWEYVFLAAGLSFGLLWLAMQPLQEYVSFLSGKQKALTFVESSWNAPASTAFAHDLTQALKDDRITADVRIYDSVTNHAGLHYVSAIVTITTKQQEEFTADLIPFVQDNIYAAYPDSMVIGRIQQVFRSPGQMSVYNQFVGMEKWMK